MKAFRYLLCVLLMFCAHVIFAQAPVELFLGHQRATVDITWLGHFKNKEGETSRFSYFSRNRAIVDYHDRTVFSSVNVLSYNLAKGFGIAVAGEFMGSGFSPQLGMQYFHAKSAFSIFTFAVCEISKKPLLEWFTILRYQPPITERLHLYSRAEMLNIRFNDGFYTLVQRARLGVTVGQWTWGAASDFSEVGKLTLKGDSNVGAFIRVEF